MKKISVSIMAIMMIMMVTAQVPQKMSYQAVIRNSSNELITNKQVGMRISIIQGAPDGTVVYTESQSPLTNANGLVSIEVGGESGFESVDWANGPYYVKTETDPAGGMSYTVSATHQLLSVPFALYAGKSGDQIWNKNTNDIFYQNGNVGIGTGSPGAGLHLKGGLFPSSFMFLESGVGHDAGFRIYEGDVAKWHIFNQAGAGGLSIQNEAFQPALFVKQANTYMGIGTTAPTALLHTEGTGQGEGNVLFVGSRKESGWGDPPAQGYGTRLMWYPDKAAFRVGHVWNDNWNKENIGNFSIGMGVGSKAWGDVSTALGLETSAANYSTAMGWSTNASGNSSTAMGRETTASGNYSTAMGNSTIAPSAYETVIGLWNTQYAGNATSWVPGDRLFVIGNGGSSESRRDALVMLKNGNTGLGTSNPTALFHTNGTDTGGGNVLFVGEFKSVPGDPPTSGAGSRMMWYPDKAAFRVGVVRGTEWDKDNIGNYSVAMGYNTKASGVAAVAMGEITTASGTASTAMGFGTVASGRFSTAISYLTIAPSGFETALGTWNEEYTPNSTTGWNELDRLFVIGNGTGPPTNTRSNALTVLKNGNVGLGTSNPTALLHTDGTGIGDGNVLFVGKFKGVPGDPPTSGAGSRMMWYPDKAAFRVGVVHGTEWDKDNIGSYSVAMGSRPIASGAIAISMGFRTTASGNWSTAIGYSNTASGNNSTALGRNARAVGDYSFSINLSSTAGPEVPANRFQISGASAIGGNRGWSNWSDKRMKKDVQFLENENSMEKIMKLQGVRFRWKDSNPDVARRYYLGFLAQDVLKVLPEAVFHDEMNDIYSIEYTAIMPVLVEGVKEQRLMIQRLQQEVETLKTENAQLKEKESLVNSRIDLLEKTLESMTMK